MDRGLFFFRVYLNTRARSADRATTIGPTDLGHVFSRQRLVRTEFSGKFTGNPYSVDRPWISRLFLLLYYDYRTLFTALYAADDVVRRAL